VTEPGLEPCLVTLYRYILCVVSNLI